MSDTLVGRTRCTLMLGYNITISGHPPAAELETLGLKVY